MRFVLPLVFLGLLAASASAQDCYRQRQVLRVVQQPAYQAVLAQQSCGQQALQIVEQQHYGSVLAVESVPNYALVLRQERRPKVLQLTRGQRLRLSDGRSLRIERRGILGLRQRIVID